MAEVVEWLRSQIVAEKEAAEAADAVSPGPWVNTGQDGDGGAWQIHGASTEESGDVWDDEQQDVVPAPSRVATLNYADGGGVWKREAADHMVLQQPRDTIARCEADLLLLDEHKLKEAWPYTGPECGHGCQVCSVYDCQVEPEGVCNTVRLLAYGRRHRPGWQADWAPEGMAP